MSSCSKYFDMNAFQFRFNLMKFKTTKCANTSKQRENMKTKKTNLSVSSCNKLRSRVIKRNRKQKKTNIEGKLQVFD